MTEYYIIDNSGNQVGPISELLFSNYGVTADTLVWREGMSEWKRAAEVPELRNLFGPTAPQIPTPPPIEPEEPGQTWQPPYQPSAPQYNLGEQSFQPQNQMPCPPTYLVWAILATVLCCLPFGIVGIVNASQVSSRWRQGDFAGAQRASEQAKMWTIMSAAIGFAVVGGTWIMSFFSYIF